MTVNVPLKRKIRMVDYARKNIHHKWIIYPSDKTEQMMNVFVTKDGIMKFLFSSLGTINIINGLWDGAHHYDGY